MGMKDIYYERICMSNLMHFQRFETVISMLQGPVLIKITANFGNGCRFGLYDLVA